MVEELLSSKRLHLADSPAQLAASYTEPCVVLAQAHSSAAHFASLWSKDAGKALLINVDAEVVVEAGRSLQALQRTLHVLPGRRELVQALAAASPSPVVMMPSGQAAGSDGTAVKVLTLKPTWVSLPFVLHSPRVQCWLSGFDSKEVQEHMRLKAQPVAGQDAQVCAIHGVVWGQKRRRITVSSVPTAAVDASSAQQHDCLRYGPVKVSDFQKKMAAKGHAAVVVEAADKFGTAKMAIKSLQAVVVLNKPAKPQGFETLVEASSKEGRRLLAEVLSELLPAL